MRPVSRPLHSWFPWCSTILMIAIGAAGCGDSTAARTGSESHPDAGFTDASSVSADAMAPGNNDAAEAGITTDAGTSVPETSPPFSGPGSIRLMAGSTHLFAGGGSCTTDARATGERWCAFSAASHTRLGATDLYVVNVSQLVAGAAVNCSGSEFDSNCLRLTGGFYEDDSHRSGFQGDSLIYFDSTGAVYGWRAGLLNGRRLGSTNNLRACIASALGDGVACLRDLPTQDTIGITSSELLVGRLSNGGPDPALAVLDTVISSNIADPSGHPRFQMGFLPSAEPRVAWSTRTEPTGAESLQIQEIGVPSSRTQVRADITRWSVSPDGQRWLWLSGPPTSTRGAVLESLAIAGGDVNSQSVSLAQGVVDYRVLASGGIAFINTRGVLAELPDSNGASADPAVVLDTGVIGIVATGRKGHVAYAKKYDSIFGLADLFVAGPGGSAVCTLSSQTVVPVFGSFSASGDGLLWARVSNLDSFFGDPLDTSAMYTRVSDCQSQLITSAVGGLRWSGDDSVLFTGDFASSEGTLRMRRLAANNALDPNSVLIQTRVDAFAAAGPTPRVALFTVNVESANDGVYYYQVPGPAVGDAGVRD